MACVVERVSLYCSGERATAGTELRSDESCQEESSRSSCSSSGGGCGGTTSSAISTATNCGEGITKNKRKAASPRRRQPTKRPRCGDSPFRPWGPQEDPDGTKLEEHVEESERSYPGLDRIPEMAIQKLPPPGHEDMASSPLRESPQPASSRQFELPPPPPPSRCSGSQMRGQRNYKNMTRERRMEANARERSRVHTISAAFETLRKAVPAYSHNQKLSKLSVLRVAASYILTLSRVLGSDYSHDQSSPTIADCVDNVSTTIQMEGKLRKRKDE